MAEASAPKIKVQAPDGIRRSPTSPASDGASPLKDARLKTGLSIDAASIGKGLPGKLMRTLSSNGSNPFQDNNTDQRIESSALTHPLSQHIADITHHEGATPQPTRAPAEPEKMENMAPVGYGNVSGNLKRTDTGGSATNKKNRVSFFGRLSLIGSKKKETSVEADDDSDPGDKRAEGANADIFSQPLGYTPRYPESPKYIKVRARGKKDKEFNRVFLAQELRGRTGLEVAQAGGHRINPNDKRKLDSDALWSLEFSKDGKYLAAGGHDYIVRVWAVIASEEDRRSLDTEEVASVRDTPRLKLSAPVFKSSPIQEYEGHTGTVLDLSWSKNNFLLSSSMDKTVRLWHTSRAECLCCFKHSDFVTSIQFHPKDDRFFLAGSLDSKLRLWSIPDKSVAHWAKLNELITAVAFTPDGKTAIAGCVSGLCLFYETEGLRHQTQMHVKSSHGKNAKGSKITAIQAINFPPEDRNGDVKLLITSNDSRIRVYNLRDKALELKLRGNENSTSQIRASFSEDAKYVISGSEDKKAYIWPTRPQDRDRERRVVETFVAHQAIVTCAIMAPARTRQILQASGDQLFEICNPPPVTLISRAESRSSAEVPTNSIHSAEEEAHAQSAQNQKPCNKPEESPAYLARSMHPNGNIIVTADHTGRIKVFRQDCAYKKRLRAIENWDAGSAFSKKMLQRSSSIITRGSRHSHRDSLSHPSTDRIQSWRQSIERPVANSTPSTPSFDSSVHKSLGRSPSPRKGLPSISPAISRTSGPSGRPPATGKPQSTQYTPSTPSSNPSFATNSSENPPSATTSFHLLSAPADNPLLIDGDGTSLAFYNRQTYESQANNLGRRRTIDIDGNPTDDRRGIYAQAEVAQNGHGNHLMPNSGMNGATSRASSASRASVISSEIGSGAIGGTSDQEKEVEICKNCGGESFRARRRLGEMVLECVQCRKQVD